MVEMCTALARLKREPLANLPLGPGLDQAMAWRRKKAIPISGDAAQNFTAPQTSFSNSSVNHITAHGPIATTRQMSGKQQFNKCQVPHIENPTKSDIPKNCSVLFGSVRNCPPVPP
ncbi:MAG TPA: hypothetical protein VIM11_20010, partial [Tepidisphaeraceae bacterium]